MNKNDNASKNCVYSLLSNSYYSNFLLNKDLVLYAKSGIKIKKSHKGKFTEYCGGKVTDECIQRGKNSSDPAIRKRATFAKNARAWKHQSGGNLPFAEYKAFKNDITPKKFSSSFIDYEPVVSRSTPTSSSTPTPETEVESDEQFTERRFGPKRPAYNTSTGEYTPPQTQQQTFQGEQTPQREQQTPSNYQYNGGKGFHAYGSAYTDFLKNLDLYLPGISEDEKKYLIFTAANESGFKHDAKNKTSSAHGYFQMVDAAWKNYGGGDRNSIKQQLENMHRMYGRKMELYNKYKDKLSQYGVNPIGFMHMHHWSPAAVVKWAEGNYGLDFDRLQQDLGFTGTGAYRSSDYIINNMLKDKMYTGMYKGQDFDTIWNDTLNYK